MQRDNELRPDPLVLIGRALLTGLLAENRNVRSACRSALRAMGPHAFSLLSRIVTEFPLGQQEVLEAALPKVEEGAFGRSADPAAVIQGLVALARVEDDDIHVRAIQAMRQCGPEMVTWLVDEAIHNVSQPGTCVRLLCAAEACQQLPTPATTFALIGLSMSKNGRIRDQVARLMASFQSLRFSKLDTAKDSARS